MSKKFAYGSVLIIRHCHKEFFSTPDMRTSAWCFTCDNNRKITGQCNFLAFIHFRELSWIKNTRHGNSTDGQGPNKDS